MARTTVIRASSVWTGGSNPKTIENHDLVIEDGVVAGVVAAHQGRFDEEVDAGGCLVVPGLINAHVHAGCTPHIRGIAEDDKVPDGGAFYHRLGPLLTMGYALLSEEEIASIVEWDAIAMMVGGATTIVEESFGGHEAWIDIVGRLGFRSDLGLTFPNTVAAIGYLKDGEIVMGDAGDVASMYEGALALCDNASGKYDDRLRIHLSPHGPDTVPEEIMRDAAKQGRERGINTNLHLAQHLNELETIRRKYDKSSIEYLQDIDFLGPNVMAMHVTFVDERDIAILAETGANVVHGSYRKAKEGLISPFWDFVRSGVNVALATDSFSHDMIQDLRFAAMLGKIRNNDSSVPRSDHVLKCATVGAAHALGRPDLGTLESGARGDAVVIDLSSPFAAPVHDPVRSMVYYGSANDIRCTLVDGEKIVEGGSVLNADMEGVRQRATAASHRLWDMARKEGLLH